MAEKGESSIDVFIRRPAFFDSEIRRGMFAATQARWRSDLWTRTQAIVARGIRETRLAAEAMAKSDPYIFTDDDVLIVGKDWVNRATSALLANPSYAIVSTLSLIEGENAAKGSGVIYDMHAVGAPMIIRKGILGPDLPDFDINTECGVIHKYVLDKGYKEGLVNGLRHNHMGHGFSSNPALHWGD